MLRWRREKRREVKWAVNIQPVSTQESKIFVR